MFFAGVALALALLELVLQLLPVSTATRSGRTLDPLLVTYPPHHQWQSATGWDLRNAQRLQSNNYGFSATRDFHAGTDAVALIGDSMIEASMLASRDRPEAQLQRALGDRPVYAMSGPGSSILDYAERIRWASQTLGVRDFVVLLERGDLRQAICGSGNNHGPCLDPLTLKPSQVQVQQASVVKRVLRHSALAQYLSGQIMLSPTRFWQQAIQQAHPEGRPQPLRGSSGMQSVGPEEVQAAEEFFKRVAPFVPGQLILLLDGDRVQVYKGAAQASPRAEMLGKLAQLHGAQLLDLEPSFRSSYEALGLKFEVGPYDAHYNRLGVEVAMGAAAEALKQKAQTSP